jgi:hypothetical protein
MYDIWIDGSVKNFVMRACRTMNLTIDTNGDLHASTTELFRKKHKKGIQRNITD